jgi:hypothetical protein
MSFADTGHPVASAATRSISATPRQGAEAACPTSLQLIQFVFGSSAGKKSPRQQTVSMNSESVMTAMGQAARSPLRFGIFLHPA